MRTREGVLSKSSVAAFAYLSVPVNSLTRERSFCVDATGLLCYTSTGRMPRIEAGTCQACEPLERGGAFRRTW